MKDLPLPDEYEYIGVFLTLQCNYACSYCINNYGDVGLSFYKTISYLDWLEGLNRLARLEKPDGTVVPVTLQGGEPTLHPGFFDIINGLRCDIPIDVLTNLHPGTAEKFIKRVNPERLRRKSPYASIRVSYHPDQCDALVLLDDVEKMQHAGFSVGIWGLDYPDDNYKRTNEYFAELCEKRGIDFRMKEFLGRYKNRMYGSFRYPFACEYKNTESVYCKTRELLIGPTGDVYRCHHDLYEGFDPVGNITDENYKICSRYAPCSFFGHCNPCDVKIKTNRLQEMGYTAVDIKFND